MIIYILYYNLKECWASIEVDEIMRNMSQEKIIRKFIDFSREEAREEGRKEESYRVTETISSLTIPEELKKQILEALKK